MTFIIRSQPPEAEDPPPTRRDLLREEREALIRQIRPRVRSAHQDRIRRRIAAITTAIMQEEKGYGDKANGHSGSNTSQCSGR